MKKVSFSSCPKAKVSHLWHPGASRAQPCCWVIGSKKPLNLLRNVQSKTGISRGLGGLKPEPPAVEGVQCMDIFWNAIIISGRSINRVGGREISRVCI